MSLLKTISGVSLLVLFSSTSLRAEPPRPFTQRRLLGPQGPIVAPNVPAGAPASATRMETRSEAKVLSRVAPQHARGSSPAPPLSRAGVSEAKKTSRVVVKVAPWGDVFVDGIRISNSTTHVELELERGQHILEVRNPFSALHREVVKVQDSQTEIRVRLLPEPATLLVEAEEDGVLRANGVVVGEVIGGMPTVFEVPFSTWRSREKVELHFESEHVSRSYSMQMEAGKFHSLLVEP